MDGFMASGDRYNGLAFYQCLGCGEGFEVEYLGISDPETFGLTIQRAADGCRHGRSLNTRLVTIVGEHVQAS
jgi:hypothetical protein